MKDLLRTVLMIIWGFSTGVVIATGVVAFLTILGIIPRLVSKANITKHYLTFGMAAILGTVMGTLSYLYHIYLPIAPAFIIAFGFAFGIFIGCLAVSLAEMLDVIPVLKRRAGIKKGLYLFLIAFSAGKVVGALYYWFYPGFLN